MKKLCAKQNRRAKQWEFRNQFARLRISQCSCEIGKAVAKIRNAKFRNAKLARLLRKFAMRNFAKDFDVFVRQMNSVLACEFGIAKLALRNWNWHCEIEVGIAKLALRNSQGLPTHCENFCFAFFFFFFFSDFQYMLQNLHKTTKLMQEKLHKSKN